MKQTKHIKISNTDAKKIIQYMNDAANVYESTHKQKDKCRAWCIRQQIEKLQNKLNANQYE